MVTKKPKKAGRSDPKKNKSLAIRNMLEKMPGAKAADIASAVRAEYGHVVKPNMVYMVKTKANIASDHKAKQTKSTPTPLTSASLWVEAIKLARQLLKATGGADNAIALIKAVGA
jgi:hypothetical protein